MRGQTDEERPRGFLSAPVLLVSASFALGIAAVDAPAANPAWTLANTPVLIALAGALMLAGLLLVRGNRRILAGLCALGGFALAGVISARLFECRFPPAHVSRLEHADLDLRDAVRISGRIISSPRPTESGIQFDMEASELDDRGRTLPLEGKVRMRLQRGLDAESVALAGELGLQHGDSIRTLATLRRPTSYRNPGVFDFRRRMTAIEDIHWTGTIKSPVMVEKLPRPNEFKLDELRLRVRNALLDGIDGLYPPWSAEGREGSVLKAILLGDRSSLDTETIQNFRVTGLYHLLVISGMNIALLAMLAGLFLNLFPLGATTRSVLVLVFVLACVSLIEQSAPTLRATLMIVVYLVARFFYRDQAGLNSLGLAALILLVIRPPWLFEAGFQLSFAAALLIVGLVAPVLGQTIEPYRRALYNLDDVHAELSMPPRQAQFRLDVRRIVAWLQAQVRFLHRHSAVAEASVVWPLRGGVWAVEVIVFTTIIQTGLMLPLATAYHRVTFAGIGLNALAIPLMTAIQGVAVTVAVLGATWPTVAAWPAKLLSVLMRALFALTDLPHLPAWLSYRVPTPPGWVAWAFVLSLIVVALSLERRRWIFRLATLAALVLAGIISTSPFSPRVQGGHIEVTALDCGPGDAFLVVLPDRTTLLIDAGDRGPAESEDPFESRRWAAGEDVVSPHLWSRQIKRIDLVVMSRGDEGELPGFAAVAHNFQVGELWYAPPVLAPKALAFLDELERRGIQLRQVAAGDRFVRGSTTIQILSPSLRHEESRPPAADGVVLKIVDGESSLFFARAQDQGLKKWSGNAGASPQSSLLVVAGANSKDSVGESLLADVSPRVLILSGGRTDPRGSSGPRKKLQPGDMRVFSTQRSGAVTVRMLGNEIVVNPYQGAAGDGTAGFGSSASFSSSSSVR